MKKLLSYLFALAAVAFAFTSCEDVPMPYDYPTNNGGGSSETTEVEPAGTGTAADPYNVAGVLKAIKGLGDGEYTPVVYVKGKIKNIKSVETEKFGNASYYITDNGSNEVYIFQSYYLGNVKFTAEDQIKVDDEVIVCGRFYNYNGNTPETEGKGKSYIYSLNGKIAGEGGSSTIEPKGEGTEASPYNVAAAYKVLSTMADNVTSDSVYISGIVVSASFSEKHSSNTYYISDDGTNDNELEVYGGRYFFGQKFTSDSQLKAGDKVVVKGLLVNYVGSKGQKTPEVTNGSRIISINGKTSGSSEGGNTGEVAGDVTMKASEMGFTAKGIATKATMSDGTVLTFSKGEGSNDPVYYDGNYASVRLYAKNTLTISSKKKIAKIVITTTAKNGTTLYNGNDEAYAEYGSKKVSIKKDNETQVSFTGLNGETIVIVNDYSTNKGGVQLRISSITITYAD